MIDRPELETIASLLRSAGAELDACVRTSAEVLGGVGASPLIVSPLYPVGAALDRAARDLARRQIDMDLPEIGLSCAFPAMNVDPRPVRLAGIDDSSETWGSDHIHEDDDWLRATLFKGAWGGQVAVRRTDIRGPLGTFSASALAAEAQAEAWVGIDDWGIELGGVAEIGLHLAQVEYGLDTRYLDVDGEAFIGGEASVGGTLDLDFLDGDGGFEGGFDAFFGMAAAAETAVGPESARVVAGGEVGIGVGVDIDATATYTDGLLAFDLGASAFLGVGGGFDLGVEIDLGAIGTATVDAFEAAAEWIASLWP